MLFSEIGLAQHQLQNSVCCLGLAFNFVIVQCDVSGIGGGGGGAGGWVTVCVCVCVSLRGQLARPGVRSVVDQDSERCDFDLFSS